MIHFFTSSPLFLAPSGVFISVGVSSGTIGNIFTSFMKTASLAGRYKATISVATRKRPCKRWMHLLPEVSSHIVFFKGDRDDYVNCRYSSSKAP